MKYAGYNYQVDIVEDVNSPYKLILKHNDVMSSDIENPKTHLSYGEKNAFALVLFMFKTIKTNPDLVILDDPISSFDKNKKYAIVNMLFKRKKSLKGKTVLMLTHDFDPIVDMKLHLPQEYESINSSFLENDNGILRELEIKKEDIQTFNEVLQENIESHKVNLTKLIYLRRYYEIMQSQGEEYQLLSNLFHLRSIPIYQDRINGNRDMTEDEIDLATINISNKCGFQFNYFEMYSKLSEKDELIKLYVQARSNYEKLQFYRLIYKDNSDNDVIRKFVNETYHFENDYLYQLNPSKYQVIPNYIITECDKDIDLLVKV